MLLDAVCRLEVKLHAAEDRARRAEGQLVRLREMENALQALHRYQRRVQRALVDIRRSHRNRSHAFTTRLINEVIRSC